MSQGASATERGFGKHFVTDRVKQNILIEPVWGCRERAMGSDLSMKARENGAKNEGVNEMKYILMMNCPKSGYETFGAWPPEDIKAHIGFMMGFNQSLRESGQLVSAEGLASPQEAKLVRAGQDGAPVTDGVFPESKEFLAGYWIVDVESTEQAYAIAARASAAPGPGGAPMNMAIEMRQVMAGPPEEFV